MATQSKHGAMRALARARRALEGRARGRANANAWRRASANARDETRNTKVSASNAMKATVGRGMTYESMRAPKNLHGFELVREDYISEYDAKAFLFKHTKTGAEVMSLSNDDENKTFGVAFRTPPVNSTGIPHILEHSVLCGSRKYPIKEPFVELIKGSLNTFLNAMTWPDKTAYPVASCNLQDLRNLTDVYLDAVFHPRCITNEKTFEQEGWHYELDSTDGPMTFKGVVFNEMKGVYSSPDSVLARECQQALFPDNTYGVDSGGDPRVIPELTFAEFKDFHAKFYHPSNSRMWYYGDDDVEERLKHLATFLDEFEYRKVDSSIGTQKFFTEPKRIVRSYTSGEGEEEQKSFVQVNWLLSEGPFDPETGLAVGFLDNLLMGSASAPLRIALEESGLGEAIVGYGLEDELRQPTYAVGLRGVASEDIPEVEKLIHDTIAQIAEEGFTQEAIEASINSIEFSLRENNTGRFPRGLSLMFRSMSTWLYEGDPFEPLRFEAPLAKLKARIASEDVFRPLMRKLLIENKHQVTVELNPDATLAEVEAAEEQNKLNDKRARMTPEDLKNMVKATEELKRLQETPDSPEALACMPKLSISDIPKVAKGIPTDFSTIGATKVLTHDLFTNDILYAEHLLDLKTIPARLLPLIPLWTRALGRMGTKTKSFVEFDQLISAQTGGISVSPFTSPMRGSDEMQAFMMVRGKATSDKVGILHELMSELMLEAKFDDKNIFKQLVLETRAGMESRIQGSGHSVAAGRLEAMDSVSGWVSEQMGGLAQLDYLRELTKRVDSDWDGILADLHTISACLNNRSGSVTNLTGDAKTLDLSMSSVEAFLNSMPAKGAGKSEQWFGINPKQNEILTVPTQVNYVGKAANLYKGGYELHGSSYVINKLLGTTWLWDRVRVSGGAYGGFSDFDSHSGMFTYLSYRDPNLLKTLDNYDATVDFLRNLEISKEELTKSIIGTIGDIDSYQLPDSKGYTALIRHLLNVSDEERQERRDQILGTSRKDFGNFADALETVRGGAASTVAVASTEAAKKAVAERPELKFVVKSVM